MDSQISQALVVMLVGMLTVFAILLLVVLSGYVIINILNKTGFVLNEKIDEPSSSGKDVSDQVIQSAIQQWSKGKAKVVKINQIN